MRAIELQGYDGLRSLKLVNIDKPKPGPNEVLIEVKAAGINFAELELAEGRYRIPKNPPFIMGFEAAGVVVDAGPAVKNVQKGARITSMVLSGGYAEYATADANMAIPIPDGVSFAEASTITVQGLSAYTLLKYAAKPQRNESILIQSAAGGVGLYLVQLAKLMGAGKVIALAGSEEKIGLTKELGADIAINYARGNWPDQVREATHGAGPDIVLEASSGEIGEECFKLTAPFGRIVIFGAKNVHDALSPEKIQQLIFKNQALIGFNIPSLRQEQIVESVPALLDLISTRKIKLFANTSFPLADVTKAFEAIAKRQTIGKVVLVP
jgi:NADPH2:quinone reductase